jgi:aminopeptidase-like protein
MNKRILMLAVVLCVLSGTMLFAQELTPRYYSSADDGDTENNYTGYATAIFISNDKLADGYRRYQELPGTRIDKLTRSTEYLCWRALCEYDLHEGEYYMVGCSGSLDSDSGIYLFVKIIDGGRNYEWLAKVVRNGE